jgi:hypothetical protein
LVTPGSIASFAISQLEKEEEKSENLFYHYALMRFNRGKAKTREGIIYLFSRTSFLPLP